MPRWQLMAIIVMINTFLNQEAPNMSESGFHQGEHLIRTGLDTDSLEPKLVFPDLPTASAYFCD